MRFARRWTAFQQSLRQASVTASVSPSYPYFQKRARPRTPGALDQLSAFSIYTYIREHDQRRLPSLPLIMEYAEEARESTTRTDRMITDGDANSAQAFRATYRLSIGTSSSEIILSCDGSTGNGRERKKDVRERTSVRKLSSLFLPRSNNGWSLLCHLLFGARAWRQKRRNSSFQRDDFACRDRKKK